MDTDLETMLVLKKIKSYIVNSVVDKADTHQGSVRNNGDWILGKTQVYTIKVKRFKTL